ncbi:HEAT repeat domain-containing protein [Candidatus Villigracilis affinis]|uniref:HEAT repeat domain-containing protein n=1 Tax=Candidatus Villigracilis affinis TaxID=3140682 RepID=UPI002A1A566B|nr:hypothetical protein [Anaerolineales bacterium]
MENQRTSIAYSLFQNCLRSGFCLVMLGQVKQLRFETWLFQAKQCLDNPKSPIPVLINLWTWRGESSTFSNFFEEFIDDSSNQDLFGLLRNLHDTPVKLLHENKLSLYLDGLDELPDSKVRLLKEWLSKTDLSVGVTCRESDFIGIRKFELPSISLKPLGWDQITIFAEKFLGESTGAEFVSNVVEAKTGERMYEEHHLFRFVQTPFFLLLILAYYKQSGKVEFNRWKLFEYIVGQLWGSDRIQELITTYKLAKDYSASSQIVRFLSNWGMKFIQNQIIDRKQFEKNTNGRLLEVLVESTLIQMNEDQIRFRHPLFADYLAANNVLEWHDYEETVENITAWAGMFVVLAGFSEKKREQIQEFLIKIISSRKGKWEYIEEKRGPLWMLGEIGDSQTIPFLIDLHKKLTLEAEEAMIWFMTSSASNIFAGTSYLTAAGRISRRLPDNDMNKEDFILVVEDELFSKPKAVNKDNSESRDVLQDLDSKNSRWMVYQQNLLNVWNAALAIGEVGGQQASEILYKGLLNFNKEYPPQAMWSGNVRLYGFTVGLARLGISGIPTLLDILSSEDPQISHVAADALYILSYPLPLKPLFKMLALHPDSVVRTSIARKLGRSKNADAIPHLVAALNDKGSITRKHPMMPWDAHYFYVADSVALALANIGTEECISAIKERLYNTDGSISIELSLERVQQSTAVELRVYEAKRILKENDLYSLLPLMGHLNNADSLIFDPVAQAIIRHHEKAEDAVIRQLITYLVDSDDVPSRKWTLIILGTIGDRRVEETLYRYMSNEFPLLIRDGAARGLGVLVSKNLDSYKVSDVLEKLIAQIEEIPAGNNGGVGIGIGEIIKACSEKQSSVVSDVIQTLLTEIVRNNLEKSKSALDALESLYLTVSQSYFEDSKTRQELTLLFEDKVKPILIESPSYMMKIASSLFVEAVEKGNPDQLEEAVGNFSKVILYKGEELPKWASHYTEYDWIQLGCSDIEVQYKLGEASFKLNRNRDALSHYKRVVNLFNNEELKTHHLFPLLVKSLNSAGLIHFQYEEFDQAIEFFQRVIGLKDKYADSHLLLSAWVGLQSSYKETKRWLDLLETEKDVVELADKTYGRYLERCFVRVSIGYAHASLKAVDKALSCWKEAESLAELYGVREILVDILLNRASLFFNLGQEDLANSDIEKAESIYKEIEDWSNVVGVLEQVAEIVFKNDPEKRIRLYQRALKYLSEKSSLQDSQKIAFALRELALARQESGDLFGAESDFRRALETLKDEEVSGLEAYIWIDMGRFLHGIGRTEEGTQCAMRGIAMQSELGLDESYGEKALREMSSNPEWRIPSAVLSIMFESIIDSLTTEPGQKDGVLKRLEDMLDRARNQEWRDEEEFLNSLYSIASGQTSNLPLTNSYFDPFRKFETELKNAVAKTNNEDQGGVTVIQLLEQVELVLRGDRELGKKLFSFTQKMAISSDYPSEIQVFGKVLTNILAGNRNPNLDELNEELASKIRIMLERLRR